jgi:hypothetical protein
MHTSKLSYYLVLFFVFHVLGTQAQLGGAFLNFTFGVDDNVTYCKDETVTLFIPTYASTSTIEYEVRRIRGGTDEVVRPSDPSNFFTIVTDLGAAANSVQNGDGFYALAYETTTSTVLVGTSSTTYFEIISVNPGTLSPTLSKTIPYNTSPGLLSGSDGSTTSGTLSYQWQQSINNAIWTDLNSGTLSYYTPTQVITQTTWFRRQGISTKGTLVCSDTTNAVQFLVYDEIIPGNTTGDQTICEDDVSAALNLLGASTDLGLTHQWQNSTDNIVYSNISNTGTSLPFSASSSWRPSRTTYFRVLTSNAFGCTVTSTITEITVIEKPSITQTTASSPIQFVCLGSSIGWILIGIESAILSSGKFFNE